MRALCAIAAAAVVICLQSSIAAQETSEFVFNGDGVVSAHDVESSIRLGDPFSVVEIKRLFPQYRVEVEICEGAPCAVVSGDVGSIDIVADEKTKKIIDIASSKGSVDIAGNRIGGSLIDAIGAAEARCEYVGDLGQVCHSELIHGLRYIVDEKCSPDKDTDGIVALPTCATISGFDIASDTSQRSPNPQRTFWNHNGSTVYLVVNGNRREFFYQQPKPGMLQAGARPDSLLFEGEVVGDSYSGSAFIFDRQCGKFQYAVAGPILDGGRRVVMRGRAPRVDRHCHIFGYLTDVLVFTLVPWQ